ncbi:MAG: hypothetical protein CVV51_05155 [Spirochaetae bacterium HGW-Spirochaetae-7]|nr:MAG: hypothetical protein CVV51_05155 [Spirochaetae bacterium HGW-Spirochaetae-7]
MIRIKTMPMAIIAVAAMLGGVAIAKSVGYYETTSSKNPVKFKTGEVAGLPNPADIRGSYTWMDIEKAFGVPGVEAAVAFSSPGNALDPADRVSTLEKIYAGILPAGLEIGTGAVRLYVALYTGLPFKAEEGSVLPPGALAILAARPGIDAASLKRYEIPVSAPAGSTPVVAAPATGTGSGTSSSGRVVVGKTTFGDLYGWGLTETQVEATTGFKPGPRTQSVRDAATAAGIEFSTFKTALQALVDKAAP